MTIFNSFGQDFMGVYGNEKQEVFNFVSSIGSLVGSPLAVYTSGLVVEKFESDHKMTIPLILIAKSLVEIPISIAAFY